jgi:hypothetical protein
MWIGKRVGLQHFDEKSERKRESGRSRGGCKVIVQYVTRNSS